MSDSVAAAADNLLLVAPLETPFGRMLFPADCQFVTPAVAQTGVWSMEESMLLQSMLRPGDTFVDIGAHVGFLSMVGATCVGPTGEVISVEATPSTAQLLIRNLENLSPAPATVHNVAAWSENGEGVMHISSTNTGDNRSIELVDGDHATEVPVDYRTMDSLLADLERLDVIKMDIQGAESQAIRGMFELIEKFRPSMLVEFWPQTLVNMGEDPADLISLYRTLGYQVRLPGMLGLADADNQTVLQFAAAAPGGDITLLLVPKG